MIIKKESKREIENAFYTYKSLKFIQDDLLEDTAYMGLTSNYSKMPGVVSFGNKKEEQFLKYLDKAKADRWIMVVNKTLEFFNKTGKDELIRLKFFDKLKDVDIWYNHLHIDRSTMYNWLDDVIQYAEKGAIYLKLLNIW